MVVPRKVVVAAIIYAAKCFTQASPSNTVPANALGNPTASAFVANSSSSSSSSVSAGLGVPLSSPTSGQISFRTKTRNGVRGAVCVLVRWIAQAATPVMCVHIYVVRVSPSAVAMQHAVPAGGAVSKADKSRMCM